MSDFVEFTPDFLNTPEGVNELNRILNTLNINIAGDTDSVRVFKGFGTPEGEIIADVGAIYMRLDGGTDTTLYRKESGAGNTGWVAVNNVSLPLSLANGGLGSALSDPGSDQYLMWDDSEGEMIFNAIEADGYIEVFTSSGTWTCPAGVNYALATLVGAGGGGGGTSAFGGSGGGGGGCILNAMIRVTPSSEYTITLGTGGAGAVGGGAGSNGTATTMTNDGTTLSAGYGTGGVQDSAADAVGQGAGAVAVALDAVADVPTYTPEQLAGGDGGVKNTYIGGAGGSSYFSLGALGGTDGNSGVDGVMGAGGGGIGRNGTKAGDGGDGFVILRYNTNGTPS